MLTFNLRSDLIHHKIYLHIYKVLLHTRINIWYLIVNPEHDSYVCIIKASLKECELKKLTFI